MPDHDSYLHPKLLFQEQAQKSKSLGDFLLFLAISVESSVLIGAGLRRTESSQGTSLGSVGWDMALLGCSDNRELRETIFPSSPHR